MKKFILTLLLCCVAFSYVSVPDMAAPNYPEGTETKGISLVNKVTTATFSDFAGHGIRKIVLTPSADSINTKIIVSPHLGVGVPGKLYKAVEITMKRFEGSAEIHFAVEKSWILENSANNSLSLFHLESSAWVEKSMSKDSEDADYEYYKFTPETLSVYSIIKKEAQQVVIPENNSVVLPENNSNNSEQAVSLDWTMISIIVGVVAFVILLAVFWVYYRKKITFHEG